MEACKYNHNLLSELLTPEQRLQRRFLLEHATDGSWSEASKQLGLDGFFNEPWMDNVNTDLLNRFWIKKGMPKPLLLRKYGMTIKRTATPLGIIDSIHKQPMFTYE